MCGSDRRVPVWGEPPGQPPGEGDPVHRDAPPVGHPSDGPPPQHPPLSRLSQGLRHRRSAVFALVQMKLHHCWVTA